MGRKNSKVRRANDRGRLARRAKGERPVKPVAAPRLRVEDMVLPAGKCYFRSRRGKVIFTTEAMARKALEQAQVQRARMGSGHVEKRFYRCPEGGCGGYHLTSRDEYEERGKA